LDCKKIGKIEVGEGVVWREDQGDVGARGDRVCPLNVERRFVLPVSLDASGPAGRGATGV